MAITYDQVRTINVTKLERDHYKQVADSLLKMVIKYEGIIELGKELSKNYENQIKLHDEKFLEQKKISDTWERNYYNLQKILKRERLKSGLIYGVGGVIIVSLVTFILVH